MKTYTKPLAEVFELRVTENIASQYENVTTTWNQATGVVNTEYNILAKAASIIGD